MNEIDRINDTIKRTHDDLQSATAEIADLKVRLTKITLSLEEAHAQLRETDIRLEGARVERDRAIREAATVRGRLEAVAHLVKAFDSEDAQIIHAVESDSGVPTHSSPFDLSRCANQLEPGDVPETVEIIEGGSA